MKDMAETETKVNVLFRVSQIQTLKFSIDNSLKPESIDKDKLQFDVGIGIFFEPSNKTVNIDTMVNIFLDDQRAQKVCEAVVRTAFDIKNFEEVFTLEGESIKGPDMVVKNLIAMSVSSARGMLAAKTEGSILAGVYLPPIDISALPPFPSPEKAST